MDSWKELKVDLMRVSKKERKENARNFYNMFMNSNCNKVAIVVQRPESKTNPNIKHIIPNKKFIIIISFHF